MTLPAYLSLIYLYGRRFRFRWQLTNSLTLSIYMENGFVFFTPWRVGRGAEAKAV